MSKTKFYFALAAAFAFVISTILCTWTALHYAGTPASAPPIAIANSAPISIPPDSPLQPASTHPQLGDKFLGIWTGHWDGTLAARFTITRKSEKQLTSMYESEDAPGQPMSKKFLHPWANDKVLNMPRASITLTLSDTLPNTAKGVITIKTGDTTIVRTATFVRGGERTVTNWLPADSPATQPIVLDIKAIIDGSDVLTLSPKGALWSHQAYQWPTDISVNGIAWDAQTQPTLTGTGLSDADLSTAKVLSHSGRDRVEMTTAPDGIAIHFDDSPPGSAPYEIKIGFNHRNLTPR
jgi:hypothetical protein